jgi:hypothetical protein
LKSSITGVSWLKHPGKIMNPNITEILNRLEIFVGGLGKAILLELRKELAEQPSPAQLAEADRRAGAAERELATFRDDLARINRVRDKMKDQWGVDHNVSFDVVWADALKLKQQAIAQQQQQHPDDAAVDRFAVAMKDKLAKAREKGRSGWETCPPDDLSRMLREHVEKGDPRDVANFAMMLWNLGTGIAAAPQPAQPTESILIDGVAYAVPEEVALEMLNLHIVIKTARAQPAPEQPLAWLDPTDGAIIKAHVFKDGSPPEGWRPIGFIDNLPAAPVQEPQDGELIRGYFEADYTTCYRHADLTWDPVLETYKNERTRAAWHGWQCCTRNTPPAAQPAQEPVATVKAKRDGGGTFVHWTQLPVAGMKLYTAAQPAPTVQEPVGHYAGDHKVRLYCDVPKGARLYTTRTSTSTCAADT